MQILMKRRFLLLLFCLAAAALPAQNIPLGCDQDTVAKLSGTNDVKTFTFTAAGGEFATLRAQLAQSSTFVLRLALFDPNGELLTDVDAPSFVDNNVTIDPVLLPLPGVYQVRVSNANPVFFTDGTFGLSLQFLRPECALPLGCAENRKGISNKPGVTEAFWFTATPGDRFILRLQEKAILDVQVWVFGTNGQLIGESNGASGEGFRLDLDFAAIAQTDTFLLLLRDNQNFFQGNYWFGFQRLRPACAPALACGGDVGGVLTETEMVARSLLVHTGDRLLFRSNCSGNMSVEFYHSDGTPWLPPTPLTDQIVDLSPRMDGTDTLLIVAMRQSSVVFSGSTYGFSAQLLRPECAVPMTCNAPFGDSTRTIAQMHAFRFDVAAGDKALFRAGRRGEAFDRMELYSPAGNLHWMGTLAGGYSELRFEGRLDTPGTWYAVLKEGQLNFLKAFYGVSYHQLNDPDCGWPVSYNTNLTDTIPYPATVRAFRFDGAAGDKVAVLGGNCNPFESAVQVYDTQGERLAWKYAPKFYGRVAHLDSLRLPATGRYKILVYDSSGFYTRKMGFSLQKLNPGQNSIPLIVGQSAAASLDFPTDSRVYTFNVNPGGGFDLTFHSLSGPPLTFLVYDPDGNYVTGLTVITTGKLTQKNLPKAGMYTLLAACYVDDSTDGCLPRSFDVVWKALVDAAEVSEPVLLGAYPNPFSDRITVEFDLPVSAAVRADLLDWHGRVRAVLAKDNRPAGKNTLSFEAPALPAGVYLLRLCAAEGGCSWNRVVKW